MWVQFLLVLSRKRALKWQGVVSFIFQCFTSSLVSFLAFVIRHSTPKLSGLEQRGFVISHSYLDRLSGMASLIRLAWAGESAAGASARVARPVLCSPSPPRLAQASRGILRTPFQRLSLSPWDSLRSKKVKLGPE